jgi:RNA polymerase sigma-70 factor (ECF subfamily)
MPESLFHISRCAVALKGVNTAPAPVRAAVTDQDERELLTRIAEHREQAAFRELYGIYYQRLTRLLGRMSMRREDVEEVINDTFWVVWTKAAEFRGASQLSTWIIGIAYRRALNTLRRERLRPVSSEPVSEGTITTASSAQGEERSQWIQLGLDRLPLEQRLALELTYTMGHSCEEIATILSCPVNTVKTRLFRARETLKKVLPTLAGGSGDLT